MVWGAMSAQGLTELHVLPQKQTVNTTYYIHEFLEKNTSSAQPSLQRGLRSAEKNGTSHVAAHLHSGRGAGTHAEKNAIVVQNEPASFLGEADVTGQLPRPEPAGEPAGNLQQELDNSEPCTSVRQLTESLQSVWANISRVMLERLVASMQSRVSKCRELRGAHIGM